MSNLSFTRTGKARVSVGVVKMAYRPQMASGGLQAGVYPVPSQAGFVPQMMIVGHLGQPMTRIMTPGMATSKKAELYLV